MGRLAGSVPHYKAPAPLCPPVRPILPALGPEDRVLGCPSPGLLGEQAAPGHLQPALSPAPTQGARENREPDVDFPHLSLVDC